MLVVVFICKWLLYKTTETLQFAQNVLGTISMSVYSFLTEREYGSLASPVYHKSHQAIKNKLEKLAAAPRINQVRSSFYVFRYIVYAYIWC